MSMSKCTKKVYIDYDEFSDMMDALVQNLRLLQDKNGRKYTHVYGPPRGGLPIAVHLSHHLDIKFISDFQQIFNLKECHLLLCDDVADTGRTLMKLKSCLNSLLNVRSSYNIATLHYKPGSTVLPDIYVTEVPNNDWIVYPWEQNDMNTTVSTDSKVMADIIYNQLSANETVSRRPKVDQQDNHEIPTGDLASMIFHQISDEG